MYYFLAINQTSIQGMTYLAGAAIKSGRSSKLLVTHNLSLPQDIPTVNLAGTNVGKGVELRSNPFFKITKWFFKKLNIHLQIRLKNIFFKNSYIKQFYSMENRVKELLDSENVSRLYVYGDRHGGYEAIFIKECKARGIPIVIPPISFASEKQHLIKSMMRDQKISPEYIVTDQNTFKRKYPFQWVHDEISGHDISYYPVWLTKVQESFGVLPSNPWVLGASSSDFICAESEEARSRFIKNGVSKHKILLTGHPEHDALFHNFSRRELIKEGLYKKYALRREEALMVLVLPQLLEHNLATELEHWKIQNILCKAASETGWNVLVSLHPKMSESSYRFLESKYNIRLASERLREILPTADLCVAGQGSSTIPWCVACEVPLIVADWYGLNYSVYDWISGKIVVGESKNFKGTLQEICSDRAYLFRLRDKHRSQKYEASPFDGRCTQRILDLQSVDFEL